jgi:hypothetical protein
MRQYSYIFALEWCRSRAVSLGVKGLDRLFLGSDWITLEWPTIGELNGSVNTSAFDRHRGGGHPSTPATPPCVRVRTRRFELVALTAIDQRRKSKRFEVSIGKPHREGLGPS